MLDCRGLFHCLLLQGYSPVLLTENGWFLYFFIMLILLLLCEVRENNYLLWFLEGYLMWTGPWVACVGLLLFFDLRGCFWFGCFLSPSLVRAAFYSLNRGCAGAWPMGIPREMGVTGGTQSWGPQQGWWLQATHALREVAVADVPSCRTLAVAGHTYFWSQMAAVA